MIVLVCYDISDDKKRNKVADILLKKGVRLQKSVYLLNIRKDNLKKLMHQLRQNIDLWDAVLICPVCKRCQSMILQVNCDNREKAIVF
ncbi:MAG: CRISPR-associated endonuclease Cas2 [Desulfonauticus sp.]|nr:CRISPR-associated endonuclease Cas2 [Desulfonauticus sp.]